MSGNKKQISQAVKDKLRSKFESACNSYRHVLERMWDLNPTDGYWIADEVGGLYDNGGFVTISMSDMIYCIEEDITYEEYDEWTQYNIRANEYNFNCINLKSWHMGCPRVQQETFDRLSGMKDEINKLVEEVKSRQDGDDEF